MRFSSASLFTAILFAGCAFGMALMPRVMPQPPSGTHKPLICFWWGDYFPPHTKMALALAFEACSNGILGNRNYTIHQKSKVCYTLGWEKRVEMSVMLRKYPPRFLTTEECQHRIYPIFFCDKGGKRNFENWKFKADPNKGPCG
ncbi:hypothetical protein F5X98DRAFT_371738 [Xylaria grammica]|nr:hypothetical protein F5X98DRAFT_371738 [Xylaria grammica]